ncbi:MAG: hypothetical protein JEZ09_11210 [Salinivirgaceae bacterium]|nr:hypothetical protein [Salinivirgaceae bacterium]
MNAKYICPKCRNSVNVGNQILLTGKTETGLKGLVLLSGELGDYNSAFSEDFTIVEGNKVKFTCPICHGSLSSRKHKNLAQLIQVDSENNEIKVFFSEIYGEKCTYEVFDKQLKRTFGDHKNTYRPDWIVENL